MLELLSASHQGLIERFDCGSEPENNFLKKAALWLNRLGSKYSYGLILDNRLAGYVTLCVGPQVLAEQLPNEQVKRLPKRFPLTSLLIAELAVDRKHQGERLGNVLLLEAISLGLTSGVGFDLLILDARYGGLISYYERFGFIELQDHPHRMVLTRARAQKYVDKLKHNS